MKKIVITFISLLVLTLNWSCSNEEESYPTEKENSLKNFNLNNNGNAAPMLEGCETLFTFYAPNLSPFEKNQIRNSFAPHFIIASYTTLNDSQEIWYTNCQDIDTYIENNSTNNDSNPKDDLSNKACIPYKGCLQKCQTSTCSTSDNDKDDEPIDNPFD